MTFSLILVCSPSFANYDELEKDLYCLGESVLEGWESRIESVKEGRWPLIPDEDPWGQRGGNVCAVKELLAKSSDHEAMILGYKINESVMRKHAIEQSTNHLGILLNNLGERVKGEACDGQNPVFNCSRTWLNKDDYFKYLGLVYFIMVQQSDVITVKDESLALKRISLAALKTLKHYNKHDSLKLLLDWVEAYVARDTDSYISLAYSVNDFQKMNSEPSEGFVRRMRTLEWRSRMEALSLFSGGNISDWARVKISTEKMLEELPFLMSYIGDSEGLAPQELYSNLLVLQSHFKGSGQLEAQGNIVKTMGDLRTNSDVLTSSRVRRFVEKYTWGALTDYGTSIVKALVLGCILLLVFIFIILIYRLKVVEKLSNKLMSSITQGMSLFIFHEESKALGGVLNKSLRFVAFVYQSLLLSYFLMYFSNNLF